MTISGDRLTRLPDTVLWQILSHALAKEAVCTGALSRPWRSLWLSSGVLNLDPRSYGAGQMGDSRSLVFMRDANAALNAIANTAASDEGSRLRKLTFTYLALHNNEDKYWSRRHIEFGLDILLSGAPAARSLEELRVHVSPPQEYSLRVGALPYDALRTLHLDGLELKPPHTRLPRSPPAPALSFPRLEMLRLRRCTVRLTDIQSILDAAPLLVALELDRVNIPLSYEVATSSSGAGLLRCPRVTALSLADLRRWWCEVTLDAPLLRHFAYRGFQDTEVLSVNLEHPGTRRRAEQIKELNLRMMKGGQLLRL